MKRKLIIASYLTLISLALSSIAVSFAWFNYGATLEVGHLDISFIGEKNLQISLTPDSFKDELNVEDMPGTKAFVPVSSMYSNEWLESKAEKPLFKTGYKKPGVIENQTTFRKTQNATTGYFQREIYLYSDFDVNVSLDTTDSLIVPDVEQNKTTAQLIQRDYPQTDLDDIITSLDKVAESMRVSILDPNEETYSYTIIDPYKEENVDTYLCGRLNLGSGTFYDYYEEDQEENKIEKEFIYGEVYNEDKIVYKQTSLTEFPELNDKNKPASVFNAKSSPGVYALDKDESIKNGATFAIEQSVTPDEAFESINIKVKRKEPKKLVVSIYLEGWDLDNTNDSILGAFIANIKFKIVEGRV